MNNLVKLKYIFVTLLFFCFALCNIAETNQLNNQINLVAWQSGKYIQLRWNVDSNGKFIRYNIYRSITERSWEKLNSSPFTSSSFVDYFPLQSEIVYYKVARIDVEGNEDYNATVKIKWQDSREIKKKSGKGIKSQSSPKTSAVSFDRNDIISVEQLTDYTSMTLQQIQDFLNSQKSILKDFSFEGKSAAQHIYDACQTHEVNPKVVLVTLQRAMGLITSSTAEQWRLDMAMGWDSSNRFDSHNFGSQIYWGTKQFRRYYENLGKYDWNIGEVHRVKDGIVNPVNVSTAGLYIYIPFIGEKNGFSGNYMFWYLWYKTFGFNGQDYISEHAKDKYFPSEKEVKVQKLLRFTPSPKGKNYIAHKTDELIAKRVFYNIKSMDNELQVSLDNPVVERRVTVRSNNESLGRLLFVLFKQYKANIIVDKEVDTTQKVTFNLEDVPLKAALDEILDSLGYKYEVVSGGIIRITSKDKESSEISDKVVLPKRLETKSFTLQYASVSKLEEVIQSLISEDGKIITDERTKTVIIVDTPETLAKLSDKLEHVIDKLDKKVSKETLPIKRVIKLDYAEPGITKNILTPILSQKGTIEILEKSDVKSGTRSSNMSRSVGQGGYIIVTDIPEVISNIEKKLAELDSPIPQVEIQAHIIEGTFSDEVESGLDWSWARSEDKTEFSINALGRDKAAGTLRLSYGNLPAEEFTAVLNALATSSDTRILSCPRIAVMENSQARFHSGDQIGFSQITTNIQEGTRVVETVFQDVGIELIVSPQVKSDNVISLLLEIQVSDLGEVTQTGEPTISDRSAQTQLLIHDGDTAVIGGLTSDRIIGSVTKVPILGNVPLLGRLFTYERKSKKKTDLTLFITPHIIQTRTRKSNTN